jgi:hypothetical protein
MKTESNSQKYRVSTSVIVVFMANVLASTVGVGCRATCSRTSQLVNGSCISNVAATQTGVAGAGDGPSQSEISPTGASGASSSTPLSASGGAIAAAAQGGAAPAQTAGSNADTPAPQTSAGAVAVKPTCDLEGAVRCAPATPGARELCASGVWGSGEACAVDEACVMEGSVASCVQLNSLCRGHEGQTVCDAQGAMLQCAADGTAELIESCTGATLCMAGLPAGKCAACEPAAHACDGKNLLTCAADGQSSMMTDCISAELCDESAGQCKAPVCQDGERICENDSLKTCRTDLTGWDDARAENCGPDLCDQAAKRCRNCRPGARKCSGTSLTVCDSQGQAFASAQCDAGRPICTGEGVCQQCTEDSQCEQHQSCDSNRCVDVRALEVSGSSGNFVVVLGKGYSLSVQAAFMAASPIHMSVGGATCTLDHDGAGPNEDPADPQVQRGQDSCNISSTSSERRLTFSGPGASGPTCGGLATTSTRAVLRYEDGFDTNCSDAVLTLSATPN